MKAVKSAAEDTLSDPYVNLKYKPQWLLCTSKNQISVKKIRIK